MPSRHASTPDSQTPIVRRTRATRRSDIEADVLCGLNNGTCESATLAEGLAVDFQCLLKCLVPEVTPAEVSLVRAEDGITKRMKIVGEILAVRFGPAGVERFLRHRSDTVRGWCAYLISALPGLTLPQFLDQIRPLANDPHFGVREWAWMAARESIAGSIDEAIQSLVPWTADSSEYVRRFASESTQPRGVWCAHITVLKNEPKRGLKLLDPLRSDPSKYVRDSVANWLNDASKTQPAWVRSVCDRWVLESPTSETGSLVKRATRNL